MSQLNIAALQYLSSTWRKQTIKKISRFSLFWLWHLSWLIEPLQDYALCFSLTPLLHTPLGFHRRWTFYRHPGILDDMKSSLQNKYGKTNITTTICMCIKEKCVPIPRCYKTGSVSPCQSLTSGSHHLIYISLCVTLLQAGMHQLISNLLCHATWY